MYLSTTTYDVALTTLFSAPTHSRSSSLSTLDNLVSGWNGDSQLQRWSSLIGIITAIVGNILISFALNIQRYAHIRLHRERAERAGKYKNAGKSSQNGYGTTGSNGNHATGANGHSQSVASDDDHKHESTYLKSPYWWGGIILMTIGEAGNFLAYGFAPASIVSPLGVVALISNCVIAPIMLKEQFRLRDFWGVVVAVGGAVTVVLSAKQQEKKLGPHEILGAITRTGFEVYMAVTVSLIGVLLWASPRYGSKTILIDLGLVGLFGGYTALSTKGVASMLSSTLWRALTTPVTYALTAVLISTAIMQVKYVNRALQRFDSTQVIPVQFVMFTLSVIIGSAVLYGDFEKVTAENMGKFIGGCLLTFFGVFLITSARSRNDDDDDDEEDSEEEREESIGLNDHEATEEENRYSDGAPRNPSIQRRSNAGLAQNGDATDDDDIPDSQSTSRVSFADPSARPRTARMYSNSSYQPSIRVGQSGLPSELSSRNEEAPLLSNPWKDSTDEVLHAVRHPGIQSITSTPVLPSEAQTLSTNVPTHPNIQHNPVVPTVDRPGTPARHSISRMMPGPLFSPLSGGLSVVIADSLRRGVDSPSRSRPFRRPRLSLQRTKSGSQRVVNSSNGPEDELGASPIKNGSTAQELSKSLGTEWTGTDSWSRTTRARSLSNTLGDLFRGEATKDRRARCY